MASDPHDPNEDVPPIEAQPAAQARAATPVQGVVPSQVVVQPRRRGRGLAIFFTLLLLFLLAGSMLLNLGLLASVGSSGTVDSPLNEKHFALERMGSNKVAIIEIKGTIMETDGGFVKRQIDQVRGDDSVKAVVLRIDSPGGTVFASDYQYHHLKKLAEEREIPLVVSMGGLAASGGYYVAMAVGDTEDVIFAEPTTWTGSIGVILPHYNFSGLMENWQIEEDSVVSHHLKGMGSPARAMTDEERTIFQQLVDSSFGRFKDIVRYGRPLFAEDEAALDAVATGQVFTTAQAVENGLVDQEGFIEDAIDRAIELAAIDADDTQVIKYSKQLGLMDIMFGAQARAQQNPLAGLLDLTTPRAYYLWTWPPTVALGSAK